MAVGRYLLDTQILIALLLAQVSVPEPIKEFVKQNPHQLTLSHVSFWEIGIKLAANKLSLHEIRLNVLRKQFADQGVSILPIGFDHIEQAVQLPLHHRDPFDRLLIAQAIKEDLTFITTDRIISLYPVKVFA